MRSSVRYGNEHFPLEKWTGGWHRTLPSIPLSGIKEVRQNCSAWRRLAFNRTAIWCVACTATGHRTLHLSFFLLGLTDSHVTSKQMHHRRYKLLADKIWLRGGSGLRRTMYHVKCVVLCYQLIRWSRIAKRILKRLEFRATAAPVSAKTNVLYFRGTSAFTLSDEVTTWHRKLSHMYRQHWAQPNQTVALITPVVCQQKI